MASYWWIGYYNNILVFYLNALIKGKLPMHLFSQIQYFPFKVHFVSKYLNTFIYLENKKMKNTELLHLYSITLIMNRDQTLECFAKVNNSQYSGLSMRCGFKYHLQYLYHVAKLLARFSLLLNKLCDPVKAPLQILQNSVKLNVINMYICAHTHIVQESF